MKVICKNCGKEKKFLSIREFSRLHVKEGYCSLRCKIMNNLYTCLFCQKEFRPRVKNIKYCSRKCYYNSKKGKIVNQMFGENNPNWNSNKYSRTYPSHYLKEEVKKRDGQKCYICGSIENLHVHHLKNFKDVREHKIDNLLTLCKDCHWNVHRRKYQLSKAKGGFGVWMTQ